MGMSKIASRVTDVQYVLDNDTLTVASGAPVTVYCVELAAAVANATIFTVYQGDGSTVVGKIHLAANTSISWGCPHKADVGIAVASNKANASCTIFHDSPGN